MRALSCGHLILLMVSGCAQPDEKPHPLGKPLEGQVNSDDKKQEAVKALRRGISLSNKHKYDDAIAEFTEAIRLDPKLAHAFNSRGIAWTEKKEYDKAINDLGEAIRLLPSDFIPHMNRGNTWRKRKEFDKAIADFNKAVELAPNNARAIHARGNAWFEKREYDIGIADITEAIRLDPKVAQYFSDRADGWLGKKQYDKAIADYTTAIQLEPSSDCHRARATTWAVHKDYAKAIADWTEAIRLDPKDKESMLFAANFLAKAKDAKIRDGKRALELAKKALAIDSEDSDCLIMMAAAYTEIGDFEEAVRWQKKVVRHPRTLDVPGARSVLILYQNKEPHRLAD